ncbi:MAG: hypothetical protein HQM01_13045 [Magnetococcales bacterium]|nr:hypothetical protein [Magnetococcales bacterium]
MKQWALDRLQEPSTWRGLILLAAALGVHIAPETATQIITIGMGLAGTVGAVTRG